jgi:hypothetical protein
VLKECRDARNKTHESAAQPPTGLSTRGDYYGFCTVKTESYLFSRRSKRGQDIMWKGKKELMYSHPLLHLTKDGIV